MGSLSKEVTFSFAEVMADGDCLAEPWQVYLRVVGDFAVTVGGRALYREQHFCLVEFAINSQLWLQRVGETHEDFNYISQESDESGLVWIKKSRDGWLLGSVHQEYAESSVFELDVLRVALSAYFNELKSQVADRFGTNIGELLSWAAA